MMDESANYDNVQQQELHVPSLQELSEVLAQGLKRDFSEVMVSVVPCPDLTQPPFNCAAPGLCGEPCIVDVGGVPYLVPVPWTRKVYDLCRVARLVGLPGGFLVGAGAASTAVVGTNAELMPNLLAPSGERALVNRSWYAKIRHTESTASAGGGGGGAGGADGGAGDGAGDGGGEGDGGGGGSWCCGGAAGGGTGDGGAAEGGPGEGGAPGGGVEAVTARYDSCESALLTNLLVCRGLPGPVLEVRAANPRGGGGGGGCGGGGGGANLVGSLRAALCERYGRGRQAVGMGGIVLMEEGRARVHVMPAFSSRPLLTDEDVRCWLKFFSARAPLVGQTVFLSHDPGLDLRLEHTHCFSSHGDGGHYHGDVSGWPLHYRAYLVPAEQIHRVDRPLHTHHVGRD